ncbi:MAG: alpha/beta hydrolase [Alcanivoracaceae bacterium]|jgi:hypothetical protein|nr:alpha/beta hydrolase [Alcanivoracaceae bacterium]
MMRLFLVVGVLLLGGCAAFSVAPFEDQLDTRATKQWSARPSDHGLEYDDVIIPASDGSRLHGWWLHARGEHRATLYFLHDVSGNISDYLADVRALPAKGISVFMLDYRGFGLSEGNAGLDQIAADAVLGLNWLRAAGRAGGSAIVVVAQGQAIDPVKAELSGETHSGRFECLVEQHGTAELSDLLAAQCAVFQSNSGEAFNDTDRSPLPDRPPALAPALPGGTRFSF